MMANAANSIDTGYSTLIPPTSERDNVPKGEFQRTLRLEQVLLADTEGGVTETTQSQLLELPNTFPG